MPGGFVHTRKLLDTTDSHSNCVCPIFRWVDTAIFYPDPAPREVGFAVTSMVKAARKPHWKVRRRYIRLLRFAILFSQGVDVFFF